jgi:predicted NBD/HSP70 family sugar kinase
MGHEYVIGIDTGGTFTDVAVSSGYKEVAARFDEPISAGAPDGLVNGGESFVLRHYCCPQCGTLFEIDMVAATAPAIGTLAIDGGVAR